MTYVGVQRQKPHWTCNPAGPNFETSPWTNGLVAASIKVLVTPEEAGDGVHRSSEMVIWGFFCFADVIFCHV